MLYFIIHLCIVMWVHTGILSAHVKFVNNMPNGELGFTPEQIEKLREDIVEASQYLSDARDARDEYEKQAGIGQPHPYDVETVEIAQKALDELVEIQNKVIAEEQRYSQQKQ